MALIELLQISKIYHETNVPVTALNSISLTFEEQEFTAIVGPSGSGKTTLLNIIGGLDTPTTGTVTINGINLTTLPDNKRIDFRLHHIGFVFQAYNLIPVLTALENVEFVMLLQKVPKQERRARACGLLESVGLSDRMNSLPSTLSGGQQQRVAVARALAAKPSYVLADEPTANLDSATAFSLLELMETLNKQHGTTFIFSTHDQRVIQRARRIITLEDGSVLSDSADGSQIHPHGKQRL